MRKKTGSFILFLSKAILFMTPVAVYFLGQIYFYEDTLFFFWGNITLIVLYMSFLYTVNNIYNGFDFGSSSIQEILVSWVFCLVIVNVFQYFILSLLNEGLLPLHGFAAIYGVQLLVITPMSIIINVICYYYNPAQKTIIIYGEKTKLSIFKEIIDKQVRRFVVIDVRSQDDHVGILLDAINKVSAVFFLDVEEKTQEGLLEYCYLNDKTVYVVPTFSRVLYNAAGTIWMENSPVFLLKKPEPSAGTLFIKRIMDIVISLLAIIITSPIMLIIGIIVRLHDHHPAIYKQLRVTKGGKRFKIYKFRSMIPEQIDEILPRLTAKDDPRVTPIGRFIRRTRLDELPQLFNVLSGSMSLVGPRPEWVVTAELYEKMYPNFVFRTKVKAGITGYAQVFGKHNTAPEEKLFLDLMYIETFSIWQDIKLILQTFSVIFKPTVNEEHPE